MNRDRRKKKRREYQRHIKRVERRSGTKDTKFFRPVVPPWIENEAFSCPCGSGHSFVDCCKSYIPEAAKIVRNFSKDNLIAGERSWRGALTKYLGYVFGNTLPMLAVDPKRIAMLAQIDVDALEDSIEQIAWYLREQGKASEAIEFFDHMASTVPLPGLEKRILAIKAVWVDVVLHDPSTAKKLLVDVDPMEEVDAQLLEAYVGIVDLPEARRLLVLDRALKYSRNPMSKLFNARSKSLCLMLLGDIDEARKAIREAIVFDSLPKMDMASVSEKHVIAEAYNIKWFVERFDEDHQAAMCWFESIPLDELNEAGQAKIQYHIGCLLGDVGEHNFAIIRLEESLLLNASQTTLIRLAAEYVAEHRFDEAVHSMAGFDGKPVDESVQVEYHTIHANLAINDKNEQALRVSIKALQDVKIQSLYFRDQRNRICDDFLALLNDRAASWMKPINRTLLMQLLAGLSKATKYIDLKPNAFGFGIDFNRMIDDAAKKTHES